MAYVVVENFSAGLDTRRHPLTAKPGTLQTLKNAHITRGGEIEKRKKFATFASLPLDTYGMQATADTIYVFGSEDQTGVTFPTGVTYQRLRHPDGISGMTAVNYSTLYGGKPFVIATFGSNGKFVFYDGSLITDFTDGVYGVAGLIGANAMATAFASYVNRSTKYTASASTNVLTVTGPAGENWTPSAITPAGITVATAVTVPAVAAIPEKVATGSFAITAGTDGAAKSTVNLRYLNASALPDITGVYVNGVEVTGTTGIRWDTVPNAGISGDAPRLVYTLYSLINANTASSGVSADYKVVVKSGPDIGTLTVKADPDLGATANGWTVQIEFATDPTGVTSLSELGTSVTSSPYNPGLYIATFAGGALAGGALNQVTAVLVDGVDVLGEPVSWSGSNADVMSAIVAKINSFASTPEYTATLSNNKVVISPSAGAGAFANGRSISVTVVGAVTASLIVPMSGGVNGVAAVAQQATYTFTVASPATGAKTTIVITPELDSANPVYFGATRVGGTDPVCALTFKTKAHVTSGSSLFFSGVNQPTQWGDNATGAGFINLSNNNGGNEVLTGLALYQGQLAAFARRSVQIWSIDTDPANNQQGQVLSNTGAIATNSIVSVGDIDVFYLSDSGVRSLRARDASNAAVVNDVGTPIDSIILTEITTNVAAAAHAQAVIEPIDGRYWLAIGSKIYVFSYFPSSQVAAWSVYEPGFNVEKFSTKDGRVYARAGNTIYLYGGTNNAEYDASPVEVILPYLDGGKPAHTKTLNGIDMTIEGTWKVYVGMDPSAPSSKDLSVTVDKPTFTLGRVMVSGIGTHVGIRLTCEADGYARLANLIAHIDFNEAG